MDVTLPYVDGRPHRRVAEAHPREAIERLGRPGVGVERRQVWAASEAERLGFTGSPTILVDGRDPFAGPGRAAALCCHLYRNGDGLGGAPTVEQLIEAPR